MKRTQVQLDEETYALLRRRAYEQHCSLSSLIRDAVRQGLGRRTRRRPRTLKDFPFVAAGRTTQGRLAPVSEHHDEALAEVLAPRAQR